ncbi:MAG: 16S rRNA (cytidine(1402)-2'-O)-methyltransferase [Bacteriovoracaceae bacterium]|nr:16S rRNA (cytidine(1402)-2'-O)-methyltransferase [Bacteriovoracaceae bacterium]
MGKLTLVTTPIGNLGDITYRAAETLKTANFIVAEDTRSLKELLNHLGISLSEKKIISYHDQSSEQQLERLVEEMANVDVVYVSEAGSPYVSDPAYLLVQECLKQGIEIENMPGVSAVTTGLELSALPPIPFHFHGFLPRENGKINKIFQDFKSIYGTHIFFEGVSRVEETLNTISQKFPETDVVVARELTKKFQQVVRFNTKDWESVRGEIVFKGEFTILLSNRNDQGAVPDEKVVALAKELLDSFHTKKMAELLSLITGVNKKECYQRILKSEK